MKLSGLNSSRLKIFSHNKTSEHVSCLCLNLRSSAFLLRVRWFLTDIPKPATCVVMLLHILINMRKHFAYLLICVVCDKGSL